MTGRILYFDKIKGFGKILCDADAREMWFFAADLANVEEMRTGLHVEFEVEAYVKKNQSRRKAVGLKVIAPLAVAPPGPIEKAIISARKPKSVLLSPSPEIGIRLINVDVEAKLEK